ncbi:hypothetical protein [Brevundimonas nasdae]|uniref:hypothetical protein n=1 Tax=Brevundimonas nasdae TaxID=172043 RepID=UPI003F692D3E
MPTTVRTLSYASPDAAGLAPIVLPAPRERNIMAHPQLKNWWRGDAGVDVPNKRWRCRKTDAPLIPSKTNFPDPTVIKGGVSGLTVTAGGSGYTSEPTVTISPPPAGGVQAEVVAVISGGAVTGFTLLVPGAGYTVAPTISFAGGGGSGAAATSAIDASTQYGGHQAMQFRRRGSGGVENGGGSGALYDGGLNLLPVSADFTVIIVGRQGPLNDVGVMWGNGLSNTAVGGIRRILGSGGSFNAYTVTQQSSNILNSSTNYVGKYADGPRLDIVSFINSTGSISQQISPGGYVQTNTTALRFTNGEFHLGDYGPASTGLSAANYIDGGDVAEVMIFDVALHAPENASLLDEVKSYLLDRYGLTA